MPKTKRPRKTAKKPIYGAREGFRIKGDLQKIGEAIARLRKKYGKGFKWHHVLQAARNKNSPLNINFTWDVTEAAQKCWQQEALYITRAITVVTFKISDVKQENPIEVRAFLGVIDDYDRPHAGASFQERHTALSDKGTRQKLLKSAVLELKEMYDKYEELTCLDHVWGVIARLNLKQLMSQL